MPLALMVSLSVLSSAHRSHAAPNAPPPGAKQLLSRFLKAFEDLDMASFIACFADDATVFFPTPEPPQRFGGKAAIRDHFEQVFAAIRRGSPATQPPFHRLEPEDLEFQLTGADTVVATFHLRNPERIARRTLVLANVHGTWLIAHLHASNVPVPPPVVSSVRARPWQLRSKGRVHLGRSTRTATPRAR